MSKRPCKELVQVLFILSVFFSPGVGPQRNSRRCRRTMPVPRRSFRTPSSKASSRASLPARDSSTFVSCSMPSTTVSPDSALFALSVQNPDARGQCSFTRLTRTRTRRSSGSTFVRRLRSSRRGASTLVVRLASPTSWEATKRDTYVVSVVSASLFLAFGN